MALTQIAKNFYDFGKYLQIPQAVEPITTVVSGVAKAGNARIFDLGYRVARVPFSAITFTDALSRENVLQDALKNVFDKKLPTPIHHLPQAKWHKDMWSASRIVEYVDEFNEKFVWAGCKNDEQFERAKKQGQVFVRRLSFVAGALSAICENAEYFGAQKIVVVAETLSKFSKIPGLSFALSTFSRGDHFFKVISLTLSLVDDGIHVYQNSKLNNISLWEATPSPMLRRALLSKIGKLFLIVFAGTLVPQLDKRKTLGYCFVGIVVDLHGVYDFFYKFNDRPVARNVSQSRLVPLDHGSSASALPNHVPSHTNSNHVLSHTNSNHRSTPNRPITTTTTVPNPHTSSQPLPPPSTNPLPPSSTQDHSKSNVNGNENGSGEPSASSQPSSSTEEVAKSAKEKVALFDQKAVEQRIAAEKMYVHKIDADQINKHK